MKKVIRWVAVILVVCIITIALNLLIEGVPLLGTPKVENIDRVVVTHTDYPNDVKEITVGHLSDEKYGIFSDAFTGDVKAMIPNAKKYRRITFDKLKTLSVEKCPVLFMGDNEAFPYDYLDDLRSYLAKGGVVVSSGDVPFYFDVKIYLI